MKITNKKVIRYFKSGNATWDGVLSMSKKRAIWFTKGVRKNVVKYSLKDISRLMRSGLWIEIDEQEAVLLIS